MQEDYFNKPPQSAVRGRSSGKFLVLALVGAVVLGGAGGLWGANRLGWVQFTATNKVAETLAAPLAAPTPAPSAAGLESAQTALGVRMAELEQRMTKLNLEAEAASGNAARAEGLLIASAARRTVERGAPLGYLEDQLKLRFGNAQPNAVATLSEVSRSPVTLDALEQGLAALEPSLVDLPRDTNVVSRVRQELSNLFVIRRVSAPSPAPEKRYERARVFLETGRAEAAIGEVERMPGHATAREWLALAQSYVRAQRALDLIETAAILEPRDLKDSGGEPVTAPSAAASGAFLRSTPASRILLAYHQKNATAVRMTAGRMAEAMSPAEYCQEKLITAATNETANALVARPERISSSTAPTNEPHTPRAQHDVAQSGAASILASVSGSICPIHPGLRNCVMV